MLALLLAPILILPLAQTPSISSTTLPLESLPEWTVAWPWMQTPAPSAKASTPEAFIPASSMCILRCESVDAAVHAIEPFVPASVMENMADPLELLKLIAEVDLPVDQIEASRPIVIAWTLDDPELPPVATIIVTCKDPALFSAPLTKAGWSCTTNGKIVACSPSDPGPLLADDSPLRAGLDRHDVVLRIAMGAVMDQFGDQVHAGIDEIAQESGSESGTSKAGATKMFDSLREAIDSVEMFDVGLSIVGDQARVALEMTAAKGSSLASVEKVDAKNLPDIARLIEPDAALACITALDFSKVWDSMQWAVDAAAEDVPAAERAQFEAAMETSRELYALAGPTMGMSGSLDESGLHAFGLMSAPDGTAYITKMMDMVKTKVPWMTLSGPDVSKVDDVDVSTFHFAFDFAAMPKIAGLDEEAKQKEQEKSEKALKAFFGPDGLSLSLAQKKGALVFGLGGTSAMHTAFTRMASKSPSPTGAQMLDLLGAMNPGVVYHLDLAQLVDGFVEMAQRIDPSMSMPKSNEIVFLRGFPSLTIAAGVEGRVWRLLFSTDAQKMNDFIQQYSDAQPKLPMADAITPRETAMEDIGMIMEALEEFANDNSGKYPDTLEPLIKKGADGKRYLDRDELPVDPWGRTYLYDPPKGEDDDPRVYTLGADGKVGGEGDDEDIDNDSE